VLDNSIDHINTAEKLGIAIKRLRKASGLSQEELAARIKIRQPTLSEIENGGGSIDSLFKIIQGLKLNLTLSNMTFKKTEKNAANEALEYLNKLENS
jgi:transcriptional regulator with XRE-family HTH domain